MAGSSFPTSRGGEAGVSAVGATQTGAPEVNNNVVVVSAVGPDVAVKLPAGGGPPLTVIVVGDTSAQVFPQEGGSIQGGAIDAPYEVPLLVPATFVAVTDNDWAVNLSAATSAPPLVRTPEMEAEAAAKRAKEKAEAEAKAKAEAAKDDTKEEGERGKRGRKEHESRNHAEA